MASRKQEMIGDLQNLLDNAPKGSFNENNVPGSNLTFTLRSEKTKKPSVWDGSANRRLMQSSSPAPAVPGSGCDGGMRAPVGVAGRVCRDPERGCGGGHGKPAIAQRPHSRLSGREIRRPTRPVVSLPAHLQGRSYGGLRRAG